MLARFRCRIPRALSAGLCLLMLITLMMGVSGCTFNTNEERLVPKMQAYLEEKYEEKFTWVETGYQTFPGTERNLKFKPKSHPEWSVTVHYTRGEPFRDNYVGFLKMDEVHDYLKPFFDEVYGAECRLFVNTPTSTPLPSDFNTDTDVKTYLSVAGAVVSLFVNIDPATRDIDARKIWDIKEFVPYSMAVAVCYLTAEGFASEEARNGTLDSSFPYLYWGTIQLYKNLRDEGYKEVNWREGSALSASASQA